MARYPEDLDRWRRAARISAEARDIGRAAAVPGATLRSVAEAVESYIRSKGAEPAFPTNLSRNVEAAHFTPPPDHEEVLAPGDVLKVDVGAHLDGAIADTAVTVEVGGTGRQENLLRAARDAVEAAIARVRGGVAVDELSQAIERAVHARGLKPIRDLSGHTIQRYLLHAGKSIPNVAGLSSDHLEEGEIVAIEPFATNGEGAIENGPFGHIVRFRSDPGPSNPAVARLFQRFRTLPFTARWVDEADRPHLAKSRRFLQTYPIFLEAGGGLVAQAEHTVLVTADGGEVLTRSPG
jgi:methionyl aminopeptidase